MRFLSSVLMILIAASQGQADVGFNFGPRQRPARQIGIFEGLEKQTDYSFFLSPGGQKVPPSGGPVFLSMGVRLIAVPKALVAENGLWSSAWEKDNIPDIVRSKPLNENPKIVSSFNQATITYRYRVDLSADDLNCVKLQEETTIPPDNRPSMELVLGTICSGCGLSAAIFVGGIVLIVRLTTRKRKTTTDAKPRAAE